MTTERKREASRQNGKQGRGATSDAGKKRSAQNARTHGLCSRATVVLLNEDAEAFTALSESLHAALQPADAAEEVLVDRIAAAQWRLQRVQRIEVGLFEDHGYPTAFQEAQRRIQRVVNNESERDTRVRATLGHLPEIPRWRTVKNPAALTDAVIAAAELEERREHGPAHLGRAFVADLAAFGMLARYEAPLRRELYAALHELERRQRRRGGEEVAAPDVVDVHLGANINLPGAHGIAAPAHESAPTGPNSGAHQAEHEADD